MYPFIRLAWQLWLNRDAAPMGVTDAHVSRHICMPWDIDPWMELNNGRTLTLYDLGRMTAGKRIGLIPVLRRKKWGLAVGGVSVRYRRRITAFQRIEMVTRCVGWDERFVYIVQSMWVGGTCCSQALLRTAVTSREGTVPPAQVMAELGHDAAPPAFPDWVAGWIDAEATRPWPPEDTPRVN
ncbi:acyl-CoA thioesterase [Jannaschia pohangensis]|uniref:Thioesterase-like superfamily protein n=1 Tax=Jannaschia pohangensis TaxID=390807 RepID=A0A1I3U5M2_9RHOB|nr:acyl-CoA thioesterase [Jannaschia pohangensis]SFJ78212.1 Thioesterase-like superfamily protein [Jannaschia pohangensis]